MGPSFFIQFSNFKGSCCVFCIIFILIWCEFVGLILFEFSIPIREEAEVLRDVAVVELEEPFTCDSDFDESVFLFLFNRESTDFCPKSKLLKILSSVESLVSKSNEFLDSMEIIWKIIFKNSRYFHVLLV